PVVELKTVWKRKASQKVVDIELDRSFECGDTGSKGSLRRMGVGPAHLCGSKKRLRIHLKIHRGRKADRATRHVQNALSNIYLNLVEGPAKRGQGSHFLMFRPKERRQCQTRMGPVRDCQVDEQRQFFLEARRLPLSAVFNLRRPKQAERESLHLRLASSSGRRSCT